MENVITNFLRDLKHTQYTGIIIIDNDIHQILKVTKYTGILQNSINHNPYSIYILFKSSPSWLTSISLVIQGLLLKFT